MFRDFHLYDLNRSVGRLSFFSNWIPHRVYRDINFDALICKSVDYLIN